VSAALTNMPTRSIGQHSEINGEVRNKLRSQTTGKTQVILVLLPVSAMTALLANDDPRRHAAEEFIRKICAARYGTRLETFPSRIPPLLNNRDEILRAREMR
jgi:hypothetical protein